MKNERKIECTRLFTVSGIYTFLTNPTMDLYENLRFNILKYSEGALLRLLEISSTHEHAIYHVVF